MSSDKIISSCSICDHPNIKILKPNNLIFTLQCERCGTYNIEINHIKRKSDMPWNEVGYLVSAWIRRQNKANLIPTIGEGIDPNFFYSPEHWINTYNNMGFPETTNEKLDALMLGYSELVKGDYKKQISYGLEHLVSEIAAENVQQVNGLTDFLKELGYIDEHPRITAKGWQRIDELKKINLTTGNSAFVAMWFADETKKYRDSVIAAINYCGYKSIIIDQQEYNDFIMNQVVALIKQSKFVVADFTSRPEIEKEGKVKNGVRGGVYWEAGMAYGLGKPVIHTCEDNIDSRNRIHFDVDQYNTIFWKNEELGTDILPLEQNNPNPKFAEKLAARIIATVGKGTYIPTNK